MKTIKKYIQLPIIILLVFASSFLSAETVTYYINDVTGSPIAAMEQSGSVIWRESYNPYGEGRIKPSQNTDNVGFTGHQKDDFTGLTYMQARYYDPIIGRFYGIDPVGFSNVHNFNRYAYANNNPYRYVDPDGEFALTFGFDVQGSILGVGGGMTGKFAISLSRENGSFKFQTGGTFGAQTGPTHPEIPTDLSLLEEAIARIIDTGANATVEAGAYVGTDANPADVEDLGGSSVEFGVAISKKGVARATGGNLGKAIDALPGGSLTGEFVVGENGIRGIELGAGIAAGATMDININADPVILVDEKL